MKADKIMLLLLVTFGLLQGYRLLQFYRADGVVQASSAAPTVLTASAAGAEFDWQIPEWLPPPPVPADNPMSEAKVQLGRHLFYDHRLSADSSTACVSCHVQALGFSDGVVRSRGIHGIEAPRNAMTLANVAYSPVLTWGNAHMTSLEFQALVPLFSDEPPEMGNNAQEQALFRRIREDDTYLKMFEESFPEFGGEVNLATLTRAIAAFERTLISANSPYDQYRYEQDNDAISESAKRGEALFFSETVECYHCHQGFNFTDTLQTSRSGFAETAFHNTGLYNLNGSGEYPPRSRGLFETTDNQNDMGRFRTQSLRNISVSAPYFHDGSAQTLDDVLDHYEVGGRTLTGQYAGVGRDHPLKDSLIKGFTISSQERADLIAFLESLTDQEFLTNNRFSNPWPEGHSARGVGR